MDETYKSLLTQSPGTAAVILVAWLFLKELRAQRAEYLSESQQRVAALKDISDNHIASHVTTGTKLAAVVEENTRAISRNSVALERCEEAHKHQ